MNTLSQNITSRACRCANAMVKMLLMCGVHQSTMHTCIEKHLKNSDVRVRTNFLTKFLTNVMFQASQLLREDKEKKAQKSDTSEAYDNALVNLPPVPPRPPRQNNMRR